MADLITALRCPQCAGTLSVREGQRIVKCPYCQTRSVVRGQSGITRYQVSRRIDRAAAEQAIRGFWRGFNRAMDLSRRAALNELFLVYMPYWRARAQAAGWIFGQKVIGSGNSRRLEPREVQLMEAEEWTGAAADVAEFGVQAIDLGGVELTAYTADSLHAEGLVFEPTGSPTAARDQAREEWTRRLSNKAGLVNVSQTWLRFVGESLALVYYPLWVGRYNYRGRTYQVVVDGHRGRVLYGKAPGNILYRALMLVAGTALGSFVLVDGLALAGAMLGQMEKHDEGSLLLLAIPVLAGGALIFGGYRLFRWGEEIEQSGAPRAAAMPALPAEVQDLLKEVVDLRNQL